MEQKSTPVFIQLLYFGLFLFVGTIVFSFVGMGLGNLFWPDVVNLNEVLTRTNITANEANYLRFIQVFNQLGMFILPSVLMVLVIRKHLVRYFLFDVFPKSNHVLLIIAAVFMATPVVGLLTMVNQMLVLPDWMSGIENWMKNMEASAEMLTTQLASSKNTGDLLINVFVMALIPAIAEELVFRGVLLRIMIKSTKKVHLSILIVAILFSAIHLQFYGFLPRLLLGLILGYLLYWTSSMWAPILFHFTNNAMAVIAFYLSSTGKITSKPEDLGSIEQSWWFLLFVPLFVYLMYYLNKTATKKEEYTERILDN